MLLVPSGPAGAETQNIKIPPSRDGRSSQANYSLDYEVGDYVEWSYTCTYRVYLVIDFGEGEKEQYSFEKEGSGHFQGQRVDPAVFRFYSYESIWVTVTLKYDIARNEDGGYGPALMLSVSIVLLIVVLMSVRVVRRRRARTAALQVPSPIGGSEATIPGSPRERSVAQDQRDHATGTRTTTCWYCDSLIADSALRCGNCGKPNWNADEQDISALIGRQ